MHPSAEVASSASVAGSATIWHLAQIREGAFVGERVIVGRGAYIGPGVSVGDDCKIQNYALVYEPAVLESGVFIGPGVVLTNDPLPRAVTPAGRLKGADDWTIAGVTIRRGASIGARAVCVAPVEIGQWAMVGAGAVVTADVPAYALMVGVPARRVGWVGRAGRRLLPGEGGMGVWICPTTGDSYRETGAGLLVEDPQA